MHLINRTFIQIRNTDEQYLNPLLKPVYYRLSLMPTLGLMLRPGLLLKASSLANSIFICLMISIFCGCLVLVSHYQNLLNNQQEMQERLMHENVSGFQYALSTFNKQPYNTSQEVDLFEDGITSLITKKEWGFYDVLVCKTAFKNDTIIKAKLIGRHDKDQKNALYLTDYDKPLRLSGKTKISGIIKIPDGRIEQAYINGKAGNAVKVSGSKTASKDKLPKLTTKPKFEFEDAVTESLNRDEGELLTNSFANPTKIVELPKATAPQMLNFTGNYILKSSTPITINAASTLKDVLIMAPEVSFKTGFNGTVHVIAKKKVALEKKVSLKYPSSIYIHSDIDSVNVSIGDASSVLGSVIVTGDTYSGSLRRKLTIADDATIMGTTYCFGATELKGTIIGSVYTDRFYLKTESSEYENVLQNAVIDGSGLPPDFISASFSTNNQTKAEYAVIKEF